MCMRQAFARTERYGIALSMVPSSTLRNGTTVETDLPELPLHRLRVTLRSPEAMELLGASLGQDAEPGDVVLLMG
jgi:hypothetical protein